MNAGLLAWAFGAGIVAAVNPCGFAILPGYVAHYLGPGAPSSGRLRGSMHGLVVGIAVTAGKLSVFALVAAVFLAGGRTVVRFAPWAGALIGGVLVLLGVWTLAGRVIHVRLPALRGSPGAGYRSAYVFGLGYGACSLACCLPIFLGIFLGLGGGLIGSVGGSAALFLAYGTGVAAVLIPVFALTGGVRDGLLVRLRRLSRFAGPASGILLTLAGLLLLVTWVPALMGSAEVSPIVRLVLRWQDWAQRTVVGLGTGVWLLLAAAVLCGVVSTAYVRRRRRPLTGNRPSG